MSNCLREEGDYSSPEWVECGEKGIHTMTEGLFFLGVTVQEELRGCPWRGGRQPSTVCEVPRVVRRVLRMQRGNLA